jgi:hypothetical protein
MEGDPRIPFARGAEPLALVLPATPAMERAGEGVHMNRGDDVRVRPQTSPYTAEGPGHINDDPDPDPNADPGAKGTPSGSPNTHGVPCANAGRDQRGGRSGTDAAAEERECDRADMVEWDNATRSTLGTCPCSRRCPWPFPCP